MGEEHPHMQSQNSNVGNRRLPAKTGGVTVPGTIGGPSITTPRTE